MATPETDHILTNPHAEWLSKLADGIRDVLSPSEYQRLRFCAEMLEALDGRPVEPSVPWKCDWPGCTLKGWHGHAGLPPDYK